VRLIHDVIVVAEPPIVEFVSDVGAPKNNVNRIGKCGQKREEDCALPYKKLKKPTRGDNSFLE